MYFISFPTNTQQQHFLSYTYIRPPFHPKLHAHTPAWESLLSQPLERVSELTHFSVRPLRHFPAGQMLFLHPWADFHHQAGRWPRTSHSIPFFIVLLALPSLLLPHVFISFKYCISLTSQILKPLRIREEY